MVASKTKPAAASKKDFTKSKKTTGCEIAKSLVTKIENNEFAEDSNAVLAKLDADTSGKPQVRFWARLYLLKMLRSVGTADSNLKYGKQSQLCKSRSTSSYLDFTYFVLVRFSRLEAVPFQ